LIDVSDGIADAHAMLTCEWIVASICAGVWFVWPVDAQPAKATDAATPAAISSIFFMMRVPYFESLMTAAAALETALATALVAWDWAEIGAVADTPVSAKWIV
jgi:hypothetical protein